MSGHSRRVAKIYAKVAQSVERETENLRVRGSIPLLGTVSLGSLIKTHLQR